MGVRRISSAALAAAARQLGYALEQTPGLEEAFRKLYEASDQSHRPALQELEQLLQSGPDNSGRDSDLSTPYPTLKWVLSQAPDRARAAWPAFREFRRQESFSAASISVVWSEFSGFITYLGAVLAVLVLVASMYSIFTLPNVRSLYLGFNSELPGATEFVFGGRSPVFVSLLLLAVVALAFLAWFIYRLRRQLRRYMPMPPGFRRIPLLGPVTRAYDEYLWLAWAGLLRAAGVPAGQALQTSGERLGPERTSGTHSGASDPVLASELDVAEKLGRLDEELDFQLEASVDRFLIALARCRRRTRLVLTVITYFLVGTFVSAMYLPLFSLGSSL